MDLKEENILGEGVRYHWYYRAKAMALLKYLGKRKFSSILDVGAGSGYFSQFLLKSGYGQNSTCVDSNYNEEHVEILEGKRLEYKKSIERSDADLMLLMDVIEHVDDDIGLIQEYSDKLAPGATILITVPAFNFLWSGHDIFLGHKRRYTRSSLIRTVETTGLSIINTSYFFVLVFPLAAAKRLSDKFYKTIPECQLTRHNPIVNRLLLSLCMCELPIFKWNRIAGLSVFCLAKKL